MAKVMVFGTFDLLHPGHEYVFTQALKRGDVTAVVARDSTVSRIKSRMPKQNQEQRMKAIVEKFPTVSVLSGDEKDFLAPVRSVGPDLILLGYDQRLPPGVEMNDLPCTVERLPAFKPEIYKSSLQRSE